MWKVNIKIRPVGIRISFSKQCNGTNTSEDEQNNYLEPNKSQADPNPDIYLIDDYSVKKVENHNIEENPNDCVKKFN